MSSAWRASRPKTPRVGISCFHESLDGIPQDGVIVAMDVIRATTTAITAVALGRRVYPARSIEAAVRLAADLERPILAGELGGVQPYGFDVQNSPCAVQQLPPGAQPVILLSTSGTRLMVEAAERTTTYAACLRNARAQADHLLELGRDVALFGADTRGEFRDEDQLCAARIAALLLEGGFEAADAETETVLAQWADKSVEAILDGASARYLRDTGQERDLDFVLGHIDDLAEVYRLQDGEVRPLDVAPASA